MAARELQLVRRRGWTRSLKSHRHAARGIRAPAGSSLDARHDPYWSRSSHGGEFVSEAEREARETRMHEANVGKIAKADVAPVAYTDDERLALLVDSLIRVAATMQSSRHAVSQLSTEAAIQQVTFEEPDGTDRAEVVLSEEVAVTAEVSEAVSRLLTPALEELGGVP